MIVGIIKKGLSNNHAAIASHIPLTSNIISIRRRSRVLLIEMCLLFFGRGISTLNVLFICLYVYLKYVQAIISYADLNISSGICI